jgi:7-cyano-7-deazaguanine reductase
MNTEGKNLKQLGSNSTSYKYDHPNTQILEVFENKYPDREYVTEMVFPEFTSLCPKTGQPDFATISISYIPNKLCIESKSLKLYLFAFRSYGSFMESITNKILEDLCAVCKPKYMKVVSKFNPRGGICINVKAESEYR